MADLLHTLMEAGLDPLDAQQIVNAVERQEALPAQADVILQDARRAWWSAEYIPNEYKRLLDASLTEQPSVVPPDEALLKKSLSEQLDRFAKAGMLLTSLARLSVHHHLDMAEPETPIPSLDSLPALIKAHTAYQVAEQSLPADLLGLYVDKAFTEAMKGGPGSGNHGHRGRPGERGGSLRRDMPMMDEQTEARGTLRPETLSAGFIKPTAEADLLQVLHGGAGWEEGGFKDLHTDLPQYFAARGQDSALKQKVVKELAKDLNVPEEWANDFIAYWANSSNDQHLASLTHQRIAAQVFGVQLSDWQREKYKDARTRRMNILNSLADELFLYKEPIQSKAALVDVQKWLTGHDLLPFEDRIIERMQESDELFISNREWVKNRKDFLNLVGQVERESEALTRKAVRSIYQRTQAELARNGIQWLTLYRGARVKHKEAKDWLVGENIKVATNALSSWAASELEADKFASEAYDDYDPGRVTGIVMRATVPASRVYALPVTGVGCLNEWEVVLIGGHPGDRVKVKTLYRQTRQTL
jgi:hypothetical protein